MEQKFCESSAGETLQIMENKSEYLWMYLLWDAWKYGIMGIKKTKSRMGGLSAGPEIEIRVAQNIDKVWISRKKSWPHLVPFQRFFSMGRQNAKKNAEFVPISLGGPIAE